MAKGTSMSAADRLEGQEVSPVNTDELEDATYGAGRRVLEIQSKLHRWARATSGPARRDVWSARCLERGTPGAGSGPQKRSSRKAGTALRADFTCATKRQCAVRR